MGVLKINGNKYSFKTIDNVKEIQEKIDALFVALKLMGYEISERVGVYASVKKTVYNLEARLGTKSGELRIVLYENGDVSLVDFVQSELGDRCVQNNIFWGDIDEGSKLLSLFDKFLIYI